LITAAWSSGNTRERAYGAYYSSPGDAGERVIHPFALAKSKASLRILLFNVSRLSFDFSYLVIAGISISV
jgi:hypothetical protein